MNWSATVKNFPENSKTIAGNEVVVKQGVLEVGKLQFWGENPRLYSLLNVDDKLPSQDDIEDALIRKDFVKRLMKDIKTNGGLMEAIIVRDKSWEVLEGNCRLASYRNLKKVDPVKWSKIKCEILSEETDEDTIFSIIGQYHIRGKHQWEPFEQAGYLFRRAEQGNTPSQLGPPIGMTAPEVQKIIEVYKLMKDHGDREPQHWSYWLEFYSNREVKKAIEYSDDPNPIFKNFKKQLKGKSLGKDAKDMRDALRKISKFPKIIKQVLDGDATLVDAYQKLARGGQTDRFQTNLKRFEDWLKDADTSAQMRKSIRSNSSAEKRTKSKLNVIARKVATLQKNLEKMSQEKHRGH